MSYILDALKKAEHERQQGSVPSLQTAVLEPELPGKPPYLLYALIGTGLAGAGLALGLLQPWRTASPVAAQAAAPAITGAPAVAAAPANAPQPATLAPVASAEPPAQPVPPSPVRLASAPPAQPAIREPAARPQPAPAPQAAPPSLPVAAPITPPAPPPAASPLDGLPSLEALPPEVRLGIPTLNVLMHAYSSHPKDRLAMINNKPLHEGDNLTPDLKLEQIVPDGMVFNYRGTRFKTGVK